MRVLVISDIHANLTALEAVLKAAGEFEAVWCLGDIVGYGPDPNECVRRVMELPNLTCIIGNHDLAALGQLGTDAFNPEARASINWTKRSLSARSLKYLESLEETLERGEITLVHGSPRHPVWEYLLDPHIATINFEYFETPYCFVGHTHLPVHYTLKNPLGHAMLAIPEPDVPIVLKQRSIINPGSVGQPRDRDMRAAYAIFDTETHIWEQRRVEYDIPSVQLRMRVAELPERHIQRLASGW
jgi:diadenosine tetraphosphatase ApaH/serine/threonine PP2A family protein phosphatase